MAKAVLSLGAELDLASGAEVAAGFDDLRGLLSSGMAKRRDYQLKTLAGAGVVPAVVPTAVMVPIIPYCPLGYYWELLSVVVIGDELQGAIAGVLASLYVVSSSAVFGAAGTPGIANMVQHPVPVPNTILYGRNNVPVQGGEQIMVAFSGALVAGQHLNAVARVYEQFDEIPVTGRDRLMASTWAPLAGRNGGRRVTGRGGASDVGPALEDFAQHQPGSSDAQADAKDRAEAKRGFTRGEGRAAGTGGPGG